MARTLVWWLAAAGGVGWVVLLVKGLLHKRLRKDLASLAILGCIIVTPITRGKLQTAIVFGGAGIVIWQYARRTQHARTQTRKAASLSRVS